MKGILLVGIPQRTALSASLLATIAAKHDVLIVEEQGPPQPPVEYALKDFSKQFKETLATVRLNVNAPAEKSDQPFYASLPKYRKRK